VSESEGKRGGVSPTALQGGGGYPWFMPTIRSNELGKTGELAAVRIRQGFCYAPSAKQEGISCSNEPKGGQVL
jgi:hypothetical protein